jgi:hypothetical protein
VPSSKDRSDISAGENIPHDFHSRGQARGLASDLSQKDCGVVIKVISPIFESDGAVHQRWFEYDGFWFNAYN